MVLQIVNSKPWRIWDKEANQPGKRLGTSYSVIRYKTRGPVLVEVKVADDEEAISADTIQANYASRIAVWAEFSDLEEDAYARDNQVFYTAKASSVTLLPSPDSIVDIE